MVLRFHLFLKIRRIGRRPDLGKRILLVGYPARYFSEFADALMQAGLEVYWLICLESDENFLRNQGINPEKIINILNGFNPRDSDLVEDLRELSKLPDDPELGINNIILMDRILCRRPWPVAYHFLATIIKNLEKKVRPLKIDLATSWRDHSVQLLTMRWLKGVGIPCVIPTRIRIPQEYYGFCTGVHTSTFSLVKGFGIAEIEWANTFLSEFRNRKQKPALKKSSRSFYDVFKLLPGHARAFLNELKKSIRDRGNRVTRYTLIQLLLMYFIRRIRLFRYKVQSPAMKQFIPQKNIKYFLYTLHTQPESSIDVQGAYFSNQIELIKTIVRSLPTGGILLVKVHPTDVDGKPIAYYREISKIPSVVLLDYSIDSGGLIDCSELVFVLTGTIGYEAALFGKPVIVFADNFFNIFPTVHLCRDIRGLPNLIDEVLNKCRKLDSDQDILKCLAALKANVYPGEVSRTFGATNLPLRADDLQTLQVAYHDLVRTMAF